jgi:diacylglycerol kinase
MKVDRTIVDFWILSLLIYIIFLLTHDSVWMILSIGSMILISIVTFLEVVNEAITWCKDRQRKHHTEDDIV